MLFLFTKSDKFEIYKVLPYAHVTFESVAFIHSKVDKDKDFVLQGEINIRHWH